MLALRTTLPAAMLYLLTMSPAVAVIYIPGPGTLSAAVVGTATFNAGAEKWDYFYDIINDASSTLGVASVTIPFFDPQCVSLGCLGTGVPGIFEPSGWDSNFINRSLPGSDPWDEATLPPTSSYPVRPWALLKTPRSSCTYSVSTPPLMWRPAVRCRSAWSVPSARPMRHS